MQVMQHKSVATKDGHTHQFWFWPGEEDQACRTATQYAVEQFEGFNWYYAALACRRIRGLDNTKESNDKHKVYNRIK